MKNIIFGILGLASLAFISPAVAQEVITAEMLEGADTERGSRWFIRCRSCHTLGEEERDKQGPNLWKLFGRQAGEFERFAEGRIGYSQALVDADFVWTVDRLNEWLIKPKDFLPGNKMQFAGLNKEEQRIQLISYLMEATGYSLVDSGGAASESDAGDGVPEDTDQGEQADAGDGAEPASE